MDDRVNEAMRGFLTYGAREEIWARYERRRQAALRDGVDSLMAAWDEIRRWRDEELAALAALEK